MPVTSSRAAIERAEQCCSWVRCNDPIRPETGERGATWGAARRKKASDGPPPLHTVLCALSTATAAGVVGSDAGLVVEVRVLAAWAIFTEIAAGHYEREAEVRHGKGESGQDATMSESSEGT